MVLYSLLVTIAFVWGVSGVLIIGMPSLAHVWMQRVLFDAWWRFWATQAVLLMGLLMTIGTSHLDGMYIWMTCGIIDTTKACIVLGMSDSQRLRLWQRVNKWPLWMHRCGGALALLLAVLLIADIAIKG